MARRLLMRCRQNIVNITEQTSCVNSDYIICSQQKRGQTQKASFITVKGERTCNPRGIVMLPVLYAGCVTEEEYMTRNLEARTPPLNDGKNSKPLYQSSPIEWLPIFGPWKTSVDLWREKEQIWKTQNLGTRVKSPASRKPSAVCQLDHRINKGHHHSQSMSQREQEGCHWTHRF